MNIIAFSGGKDSTALLLWARENLSEFTAVFCDTGWEHPSTYLYIEYINKLLLNGGLVTVRSEEYSGMEELVVKKKRVPSAKARFCTEELKVKPMKAYLDTLPQSTEVVVYQGIRGAESFRRSKMKQSEFSDYYNCQVERPLFDWSDEQVFGLLKKHGVEPNPLYLLGAGRVGCFPCIMISHRELRAFLQSMPEVKDRIRKLEELVGGRSFFPPGYIPERFNSKRDEKSGKTYPCADDVFKYIEDDPAQIDLLPIVQQSCMSIYNLCE